MSYGFNIMVSGDYALFTQPAIKSERVSYPVPTPSALVGLVSSVYWHRGIRYTIDEIRVYNPIDFINIKRNEVSVKLSKNKVIKQMRGDAEDISIYTKDTIQPRGSKLLRDVCYGISFHFEITDEAEPGMDEKKCYNILLRRLKKGQHFSQPFLGCREFPAKVTLVEELPKSTLTGEKEFGYMLYDLVYKKDNKGRDTDDATPRFYCPKMIDGVVDVAEYAKEVLC